MFYKRRKEVQAQIPVWADWVDQCFIRCNRKTEVWGSNPTEVVVQFFSEKHFSEVISTQQPGPKQNPLKHRSTSYLHYIKMMCVISTLNRFFYPSTSSTLSAVPILLPRETQDIRRKGPKRFLSPVRRGIFFPFLIETNFSEIVKVLG